MPQYESPLNKLADQLPNFLLQMQEMKLRQDAQEAINSYRASLQEDRFRAFQIEQDARDALGIKRGQQERRAVVEDLAKYGAEAAKAISPGVVERDFSEGIPEVKEEKEKKPSASDIAYARKRKTKFQTVIDTESAKITLLEEELNLAPGEQIEEPSGWFTGKKRSAYDNLMSSRKAFRGATASLDSLMQEAKKRNIDLEFGAAVRPVQFQTLEEFNALPSGTLFIDPDTGEKKIKP